MQINGGLLLPLNMAVVYISFQSIGYSADFQDDPLSWVVSLLWVFSKECIVHHHTVCLSGLVMLPSLLSCCPMFKGKLKKFYLCSQNSLYVSTFELVLWLSHSHNSRTLFRVSGRRCGIDHGPPLMRLFPSTSAHHPGNSLRNKNLVPWDLYALMTDSLALNIGSHHWPLIDRIDWVFDIRTSIHTQ